MRSQKYEKVPEHRGRLSGETAWDVAARGEAWRLLKTNSSRVSWKLGITDAEIRINILETGGRRSMPADPDSVLEFSVTPMSHTLQGNSNQIYKVNSGTIHQHVRR